MARSFTVLKLKRQEECIWVYSLQSTVAPATVYFNSSCRDFQSSSNGKQNVLVYENNKYLIEILSEDKVKRLRC